MRNIAAGWLLIGGASLVGCMGADSALEEGKADASESENIGQVSAALTSVPPGVTCLRIVVGTTATNFSLYANGNSTQMYLGALPAGLVTVKADAYAVACPADDREPSEPSTWESDPLSVRIRAGLPTTIPIVLRPKSTGSASVDFRMSATSIAIGGGTSYAVLADGTVRMWGYDKTNVLGGGINGAQLKPKAIPGLTNIASVAAGNYFACALSTGGTVACFGKNDRGQLGDGTTIDKPSPTWIWGLADVRAITAGMSHVCALLGSGKVKCWGENNQGQLGVAGPALSPIEVYADAIDVSAGSRHTCLVTRDRFTKCTGANESGQLGSGNTATDSGWNFVVNGHAAERVFAGSSATCRTRADGVTACWGSTASGELGIVPSAMSYVVTSATEFGGYKGATEIAVGGFHTCALVGASVLCAGSGEALGDGSGASSIVPVRVLGLTNVVEVKSNSTHTCARRDTGDVYCWGKNQYGQLGDGSKTTQFKPVLVGL